MSESVLISSTKTMMKNNRPQTFKYVCEDEDNDKIDNLANEYKRDENIRVGQMEKTSNQNKSHCDT